MAFRRSCSHTRTPTQFRLEVVPARVLRKGDPKSPECEQATSVVSVQVSLGWSRNGISAIRLVPLGVRIFAAIE